MAGLVLAPNPARASCGDYVLLGKEGMGRLDQHNQPGPLSDHERPCSGPNCSRQPMTPPAVPVAPSSTSGQEWGCTGACLVLDRLVLDGCIVPAPDLSPRRLSSPVFHPPRDHSL
jgi:hypothetical protein